MAWCGSARGWAEVMLEFLKGKDFKHKIFLNIEETIFY